MSASVLFVCNVSKATPTSLFVMHDERGAAVVLIGECDARYLNEANHRDLS